MLQVISRDTGLVKRGYLPWRKLSVTLRDLAVPSWQMTVTPHPDVVTRLEPGHGVIIVRDGQQILSGPIEDDGPRTRSADDGDGAGPGTLTVGGGSDLAIVAGEIALPDPTVAIASQPPQTTDTQSALPAETVIKHYVERNVGTSRPVWRNDVTGQRLVSVAADQARGLTVSYSAQFDPLMDIIRQISEVGGGLRPRTSLFGTDIVFDVYEPVDLSGTVRFGWDLGNLREVSWTRSAPTATHVVVAGGEDAARVFVERKDIPAAEQWRMVSRVFVDQSSSTDTVELQQAGDEALADGAREGVLSATAVETSRVRFGRDFDLGDTVRIEPESGVSFVDVVSEVHIEADADTGREDVTITLGTPQGDTKLPEVYRIVDQLARRVIALERRK